MADPRAFFEGNIRSLRDRELAARLAGLRPDAPAHYRFLEARNGDPVPALLDTGGNEGGAGRDRGGTPPRPLHSLMDPRREGERLISTLRDEDFLIFLGLGGAYHIEAALERPETAELIVVEFGLRGLAELFCLRDLGAVLGDGRLRILADPPPGALEELIPRRYLPALSGGIRVLPLRPRVEAAPGAFEGAAAEIRAAIGRISPDYSVQAHFGIRMFKNILRNILTAEETPAGRILPRIGRAAICAAGPSLDLQIPRIAESREGGSFLIAADTSLPALRAAGLEPDAVVSIDCQHISYRHFIPPRRPFPEKPAAGQAEGPAGRPAAGQAEGPAADSKAAGLKAAESKALPLKIPLFLDLTSPPLLASLAEGPVFFSGGHPLANYLSSRWRPFPAVDTSGGNVTYAAVSLALSLGAGEIELYGADFSYPLGRTYARGTYIFPWFEIRQNRLRPLEALFSNFLYRSPLEKRALPQANEARRSGEARRSDEARRSNEARRSDEAWYYETETLARYREALEANVERTGVRLFPAGGLGPPLRLHGLSSRRAEVPPGTGLPGELYPPALPARDFLAGYREKIRSLPILRSGPSLNYPAALDAEEGRILATLLPLAAALRRKDPRLRGMAIVEETKRCGIAAIDQVLG